MKNSIQILFLSLVLAASAGAAKATGIALLAPVTIDPDSKMPDAVRQECRLDYQLQNDVLAAMQHYDHQATTTTDPNAGQVLKVTITYVLGVGGGAWTGPKVLAVKTEYLNDGKVEYVAKMHRRSSLGGVFRGTCSLLNGASKGLGKYIAKWAQHPKSNLKDEEDPDAPAGADKDSRPGVVNGIDPDAEAPVAASASGASR